MSAGPDSGLVAAETQSKIREVLNSAEELMHLSRADEALEMLQSLLEKDENHLQTLNTLGLCHYRMKNYDQALGTFKDLIQADPEQTAFRLNMSLVLIKLNQLDEAHQALDHVLSIEPAHQRAHSVLGLVYEQKGEFDKAMIHYERGGEKTRLSHLQRVSLTPPQKENLEPESKPEDQPPPVAVTEQEAEFEVSPQGSSEDNAAVNLKSNELDETAGLKTEAGDTTLPPSSAALNEFTTTLKELTNRFQCPTLQLEPQKPADDLLLFPIQESACVRLATTSALIGALRTQKVLRQTKDQDSHIRLGGEAPLTRLIGKGAALLFTGDAQRNLLALDNETVSLMEDTVLAFSSGIKWHNSTLSGPNFDLQIVHLKGTGHIAIATSKALLAIPVKKKMPVQAHSSQVVGWVGTITPVLSPFSIEPEEDNTAMLFEGEGTVWVLAENPKEAQQEL